MQSKRIGKERLFRQSMAFALLAAMALCLTPLGAVAQQSTVQQSPAAAAAAPAQQAPAQPGTQHGAGS